MPDDSDNITDAMAERYTRDDAACIADARWFAIKAIARHVFLCWPRRWSYEYLGRGKADMCAYRRTCLRCGLIHEHDE